MTGIKKERELQRVGDLVKIQNVLKNHLLDKPMYIKGVSPPPEIRIVTFSNFARNEVLVDIGNFNPEPGEEMTFFRVLGRYIEVTCRYIRKDATSHYPIFVVTGLFIANKERQHLRIPIFNEEVHITNFRTSKQSIEATMFNIPTSVKVNFGLFEQKLKNSADIVKIDVYQKRNTRFDEVRKTGKPLLVQNTQAPSSYTPPSSDYLDYAKYLGIDITTKMSEYRNENIVSEVIYPLIYRVPESAPVPLGYILMQSRNRQFDTLTIQNLEKLSKELLEKIQDSNTVLIKEKQRIVNLSRGGLKVMVTHPELKEYLIRQSGFTADIVFKMQAPVTLYIAIRSAAKTAAGDLLLGLQIVGNSSRENEMKRYQDNINLLEARIKKR